MRRTQISSIHRLGVALGVGLTLTVLACGSGGGDTEGSTAGTDDTTSTETSTSASSDAETEGTTGGPSATTSATTTTSDASATGTATTDATSTTSVTTTTGLDDPLMGFFVSSAGSPTGNLGGLAGADQRCQDLATAVGAGGRTWHAYLSVEKGANDMPEHARDRIGQGPWYNAALELLASDLDELHALDGDHTLFLDENGAMVNGQWEGSPEPNEHDILTGTDRDGNLVPGKTCGDWTSEEEQEFAQVGHSDGLGPNMSDDEMYRPWNSVHENGGCHDTAPKGGAGRIYCFAID